jgi:hypothetical protein
MIIVVEGTKSFKDYETFIRAMGVALSSCLNDKEIEVWSAGPHNVNNFTAAFCNTTENYLKQKGKKISFKRLPSSYVQKYLNNISYFAYFASKKEPTSKLFAMAELNGIEAGVFRA